MVLNKERGHFITIEEDLELQQLEKEKQQKAKEEALKDDLDDEPSED